MSAISRNNHYVPQMYLSKWMINNSIYLYRLLVSDSNVPLWSRKNSTKGIGGLENLYVRYRNDAEIDDIENYFSVNYETPSKTAYEKVCSGGKLDKEEWFHLISFVAAQWVRTPKFLIRILDFQKQVVPELLQEELDLLVEKIKNDSITNHNNTSGDEMIPMSLERIEDDGNKTTLQVQTVVGKSTVLMSMIRLLEPESVVQKVFHSFKWSVIDMADGVVLPTTDSPVVLVSINDVQKLKLSKSLIGIPFFLFPLSPCKVLIGSRIRKLHWRMKADVEFSREIKKIIINNAFMYVFSSNEDPNVETIRPRIVDREEYNRLNEELSKWHQQYIEEEVPILRQKPTLNNGDK